MGAKSVPGKIRMTTEEAFVKVLQKHKIDNAFGIIGSAMMPISDLFPAAGIKFWDCAHVYNDCAEWPWDYKFRYPCENRLLESYAFVAGHSPGCQQNHWARRFP